MALEIKMPQLSDTMHSGKIVNWSKKEGDSVNRGDVLAEVETDKANLQIESFQQGTLLKIIVPAQSTASVGEVIAIIGQAGESVAAPSSSATAKAPAATPSAPSTPAPQQATRPIATAPVALEATRSPAQLQALHHAPSASSSNRIKASPLARKVAEQRNVDLSTLQGSGPNGRIVKKDVDSVGNLALAPAPSYSPTARLEPQTAPAPRATSVGSGRLTPLSKMRETIARRMQESVTQSPHFYVSASINMREAVKLREVLKERPEFKGISINHLVIKAAAYGLQNEPRVNRAIRENQIYEPEHINVGIITAIEDGLLIPVIKEANTLPLKDLVFEARAAVDRARAGRPNATDLSGGSFSISNMGMYDVENFTAIINPGQGAVLAVSATKEEAVVENGQVVVGLRMKVTLSVDHRIIDGVMGANFLKYFKQGLEIPALLMN